MNPLEVHAKVSPPPGVPLFPTPGAHPSWLGSLWTPPLPLRTHRPQRLEATEITLQQLFYSKLPKTSGRPVCPELTDDFPVYRRFGSGRDEGGKAGGTETRKVPLICRRATCKVLVPSVNLTVRCY